MKKQRLIITLIAIFGCLLLFALQFGGIAGASLSKKKMNMEAEVKKPSLPWDNVPSRIHLPFIFD